MATAIMVSLSTHLVRTLALCGPSPYWHSGTPGVPNSSRMCDYLQIVVITVIGTLVSGYCRCCAASVRLLLLLLLLNLWELRCTDVWSAVGLDE